MHFFCGKMASGKSTLSKQLAGNLNGLLICEDLWLSRLYANEIHGFDDYLKYAGKLKEVLEPHIVDLLRHGNSVVLDFPANTPRQRAWFRGIFEAAAADHVLHFVDVADTVCKQQLQRRNIERPPGSMAMSEDEFDLITSYFVPPVADEHFNVKVYGGGTLLSAAPILVR